MAEVHSGCAAEALGGNNTVCGEGGADSLHGQGGHDEISGGGGTTPSPAAATTT